MERMTEILKPIPIPKMIKIRQKFDSTELEDVVGSIQQTLKETDVLSKITNGDEVAIAVGSRGVSEISLIIKEMVKAVKSRGAIPFIIPAMGSHGGATAEGQKEVLESLGVTEEFVDAEIRSSMDVIELGKLDNGLRIYTDKHAYNADKIIIVNRIKPHTAFEGPFESGIMKMITIGLGKQKGAESAHQFGFGHMAKHIPEMAKIVLHKVPVIFGLASIENAYERPAKITAIPVEQIERVEPILLKEAKALMPRLLLNKLDVLVINKVGKDISGSGLDPQISGRYPTPYKSNPDGTNAKRVVILDLTDKTDGNANGIGFGDIITKAIFDKIIWEKGYFNALTSTVVNAVKVPMFLPTQRLAVKAGIKTSNALNFDQVRLVRINSTLDVKEIWISEALLQEAKKTNQIEILTKPLRMTFTDDETMT